MPFLLWFVFCSFLSIPFYTSSNQFLRDNYLIFGFGIGTILFVLIKKSKKISRFIKLIIRFIKFKGKMNSRGWRRCPDCNHYAVGRRGRCWDCHRVVLLELKQEPTRI